MPELRSPCAEDCVHPDHHHGANFKIMESPQAVGCFQIGGSNGWSIYLAQRPNFIARFMCRWLLRWVWVDVKPNSTLGKPIPMP